MSRLPLIVVTVAAVLAGCATGPDPAKAPFHPKLEDAGMSKAQRLALATGVNDARNEPIPDIPRERAEAAIREADTGDSALASGAKWKATELGINTIAGVSMSTGIWWQSMLSNLAEGVHPARIPAIYAWRRSDSTDEKELLAKDIAEAFRKTAKRKTDFVGRLPLSISPRYYSLGYRYRDATEERYGGIRIPKKNYAGSEIARTADNVWNGSSERGHSVPNWMNTNNKSLLRLNIGFDVYNDKKELIAKPEGVFPGVSDVTFLQEMSSYLPENTVIYAPVQTEQSDGLPMFFEDGERHVFIEPAAAGS